MKLRPSLSASIPYRILQITLTLVLILSAAVFTTISWHWPLVGDAPLLHYIVFLTQYGLTPYRNVIDLNLPGTLAVEAAVMALFGKGALAWRLFDLTLLGVTGVATAAICRNRFAALLAAVTFAMIHGRDGLIQLGQRDLLMATLLVCAYALLFRSIRTGSLLASCAAGMCLGAASAVKPDALILLPPLLALVAHQIRREGHRWRAHLAASCAGALLPIGGSLGFLLHEHALGAFLRLMLHLAPYHASLWRLPADKLLTGAVSSVLLPFFCLWILVFVTGKRWKLFRDQALLLGFLFGIFSFCVQGKGYPYHRYPSEVFLLLLGAIAFTDTLRHAKPQRPWTPPQLCAATGLLFAALVIVPRSLLEIMHFDGRTDAFDQNLQHDLTILGAESLNEQVQCLDMAGGCTTVLYRMQLVERSGFLYDCYLYPESREANAHAPERDQYRLTFKQALLTNNPKILIVSSDECGPPDFQYNKLTRWPWLNNYIATQYILIREWTPRTLQQWGGKPVLPYGYRIYALRPGTPGYITSATRSSSACMQAGSHSPSSMRNTASCTRCPLTP